MVPINGMRYIYSKHITGDLFSYPHGSDEIACGYDAVLLLRFQHRQKKLMYMSWSSIPMKRGNVMIAAVLVGSVFGFWITFGNLIPVLASVDRAALESIDLHLEECIKQFQAGYTKNALSHCEISEQELDAVLENTTGP